MKFLKTIMAALFCMAAASCSEIAFGDDFLGEAPESDGATLETMFSSKNRAEQVLTRAYMGLKYGLPVASDNRMGNNVLEALTDLSFSGGQNISDGPINYYYNGALSAINVNDNGCRPTYKYGSETDKLTIRYAWIFIENVDRVPDMTIEEKEAKKAEAKMLIALSYFNMLRYIGGFIYFDHSTSVSDNMSYKRNTFAESVDIIRSLLDDAIPHLPWKWSDAEDGRMTAAGAMALKFKLLHYAASPTFNSDTKWHPDADEYTCYGNYDVQRWKDAETAGREFFEAVAAKGGYGLIMPTEDTHQARRNAFQQAYYRRGGTEVLVSIRKGYDASIHNILTNYGEPRICPTLNYVNMFAWEDGTDFPENFDWSNVVWNDAHKSPFFTVDADGTKTPTRDPRLYETVAVPGDTHFDSKPAKVFIKKADDVLEGSGFLLMKFVMHTANERAYPVQWPHTRIAEVMLGYAEAICEANNGPTDEAYKMVNDVRRRVGLPALPTMNKEQFIDAVLRERAMELGYEEVRWFDLVRRNRVDDFRKKLYGLRSLAVDDDDDPSIFTFTRIDLSERFWVSNWDSRWYLSPIPQNEINKNYGMTQNPGW